MMKVISSLIVRMIIAKRGGEAAEKVVARIPRAQPNEVRSRKGIRDLNPSPRCIPKS